MSRPRSLLALGLLTVFLLGACAPAPTPTPTATPTKAPTATPRAGALSPEAEQGKALFTSKGCAGCHGPNAEGSGVGPNLAGKTEAQVKKQVRTPTGAMPAFTTAQVSDEELNKIAAFITSLKR